MPGSVGKTNKEEGNPGNLSHDEVLFLFKATSSLLETPLNYRRRLRKLAKLTIPKIADWCIIYAQEEDGSITRLAFECADPANEKFVEEVQERFRLNPQAKSGVPRVLRTGKPVFYPKATPEILTSDVNNPAELTKLVKPLQIRSWMCIPLNVTGQTIGAITFMTSGPNGRVFTKKDLRLAEELAKRAALTLDNARLYKETTSSGKRYKRLIELSPDAMAIHIGGEIVFVNQKCLELVGAKEKGELLGKRIMQFVHPSFRKKVREESKRILRREGAYLVEEKLLRLDGSTFDAEVAAVKTTFEGKEAILVTVRDVTERKRTTAILESINKSILKFLFRLDLNKTYQAVVTEAVRLVNASSGGLFLAKDDKLYSTAIYPSAAAKKAVTPREKGYTHQAYKKRKIIVISGKRLEAIHSEFKGKDFGSAIFIPLSYHKKSIGTLTLVSRGYSAFNEEQLGTLKIFGSYATLAILNAQYFQETKEALSLRDLFISMAAHELRTPLTSISGYVQLLRAKQDDFDRQQRRWVEDLFWETQRLAGLVNELLEINRIRTGKLSFNWAECSLRAIMARAIADFQFSRPTRKIIYEDHLSAQEDLFVGDPDKLLQVVLNLLDNAAKFSESNKEIRVTVKKNSTNLIVMVKDRGVGIPQKELSKIFKGFYKTDKSATEGMGLGLFLSKSIIEAHKGSISIDSKARRGTTVTVELPSSVNRRRK